MKRNDYLKSIKGQACLRFKRQMDTLHIHLNDQESKSKNAISDPEKVVFQNGILADLTKQKRRYFKAPVALEFDFYPTKNDPPAIHTMPKYYLDLLEQPVRGVTTRRKRLILEDDKQVHYLAVKYHLPTGEVRPGIWIKAAPYRDFLADIELLNRIRRHEFDSSSDDLHYCKSSVPFDELAEDDEYKYGDDNAVDRLREHEGQKAFWVSNYGEDVYEAWREMCLRDVQNQLLKILALTPAKLLQLMSPHFSDMPAGFDDIHAITRNFLISEPFAIDLKHSNLKNGESSQYKDFVKKTIAIFAEQHSILFPLLAQVGVTILFQPPASGSIDLDNLARRIVPFLNEELKPPSNLLFTVNAERCRDPKLKLWFQERQNVLKRMPKHSITHYQVVQLPRLTDDSEHGFVRLILEPGEGYETLWGKVENLVDKWLENLECR
jgi:hypothetical protein